MATPSLPARFGRILVPVDLSAISFEAVDLARRLVHGRGRVRLLYVQSPVVLDVEAPVVDRRTTQRLLERARRELERRCAALPGTDFQVVEGKDTVEETIAAAAKAFKADAVAMTTHGRGGLSKLFAGSVAQKLYHAYSGPLLLLRPRRRPGR